METNEQPTEPPKKKHSRGGFASMSPDRRREIASLGGRSVQAHGRAQMEFTRFCVALEQRD